jgi:hypothetical protein
MARRAANPISKTKDERALEHGFTNDESILHGVRAFRDAAVADGWMIMPRYEYESVDSSSYLEREGFHVAMVTRTRSPLENYQYEASIHIWGPDGLAVEVPEYYAMEAIREGLRRCRWCRQLVEQTVRVSFATRVCEACRPAAQQQLEYRGWCE